LVNQLLAEFTCFISSLQDLTFVLFYNQNPMNSWTLPGTMHFSQHIPIEGCLKKPGLRNT